MLDKETLLRHKKAAELELEGLQLLAKAAAILDGTAAMQVEGDPAPVVTVETAPAPTSEEQIVLMLPEDVKTASLTLLRNVQAALSDTADGDSAKLAKELDEIAQDIEKNAFVYERDIVDPEPEMEKFFKDGVVEAPASLPKNTFDKDVSHEVARVVTDELPYQKLNTGK